MSFVVEMTKLFQLNPQTIFSNIRPSITPKTTRLTIKTPEQYKQLENGEISPDYELVIVEATAHPDIFSLPKKHWKAPWLGLYFVSGNDRVHLFPRTKALWSIFQTATNATLGLPANYKGYELLFGNAVDVSTNEIDYILTWESAERLLIFDRSNIAYVLSQRITYKTFRNLGLLELNIQRDTYKIIDVNVFLRNMRSLKVANFRASALTQEEFDEFVRWQKVPGGWKLSVNPKWISYQKQ